MKFWTTPVFLTIPLLFCQCATERRVIGDGPTQSSLTGSANLTDFQKSEQIKNHFAGWKPDEANWYAAAGETDKKKIKDKEETRRRSSFESKVDDTRANKKAFTKSSQWEDRKAYTKDFAGTKEKKTFAWPWQNKESATKDSTLAKDYQGRDKTGREADIIARESHEDSRESSKMFGTKAYDSREPDFKKKDNIAQKKADDPGELEIIEDRGKVKDDKGWSVSDIRKFLGKS